jgi:hypothetical protein
MPAPWPGVTSSPIVINLQTVNRDFTFEYSAGLGSPEYSGIIEFVNVRIIAFSADRPDEYSAAAVSPSDNKPESTSRTRITALAAVRMCTGSLSLSLSLSLYLSLSLSLTHTHSLSLSLYLGVLCVCAQTARVVDLRAYASS